MKKLFLTAIAAIGIVYFATAQESTWGFRAGMNLSTVSETSNEDIEADYKMKIGWRIGVIGDFGLSEKFYIQPGLYFTTLGAKQEFDGEDITFNLNYLQLPVLASYRISLNDYTKVHLNAGPYVAYGVSGKVKYDGAKIDAFGSGDEEAGLKRFDAGLSFGLGMSINKIYWGIGYDLGLANMVDIDDFKDRNRNFFITMGFNF